MGLTIALTVVAIVTIAAFAGMITSWRRRARAQSGFIVPEPPAASAAEAVLARASGLHVATTFAGRPLDRVLAGGLGFRSRCELTVTASGIVVALTGSRPVWVAASSLTGAGVATWTIDRAVEPGGLAVLAWRIDAPGGPVDVESAFRLAPAGQPALLAAAATLLEDANAQS